MAKVRKRKPGGGRKPRGSIRGKVEAFSTRITPQTRQALEAEAEASGQSISQVAERLMVFALNEKKARQKDKPMRALCFLIAALAGQVTSGTFHEPNWRTDAFFFQAFKVAVNVLLDALEPPGEIKLSDEIKGALEDELKATWKPGPWLKLHVASLESPEARGEYAADHVLNHFFSQRSPEIVADNIQLIRTLAGRAGFDVTEALGVLYGFNDAARDLGVLADSNSSGTGDKS